MMRHLGIIGSGGMASTLLAGLKPALPAPLARLSVLVRPGSEAKGQALMDDYPGVAEERCVFTSLDTFLADAPEVVVECAGHGAVQTAGEGVLRAGADLIIISVGALADASLETRLRAAAGAGNSRISIAPGAVGGLDALAAARLSGIESVTYTGRKPPLAWRGSPAEKVVSLDSLTEATVFFEGTAREAGLQYPQNSNVAAAIALAGVGFEQTRVRLLADPAAGANRHEIEVRSSACDFTISLAGRPSPSNPKTSLLAGYSLARAVLNRVSRVEI